MHAIAERPRSWLWSIAAIIAAAIIAAAIEPAGDTVTDEPVVVLESERALPQFGVEIAASGQRVVTLDGDPSKLAVRIDRVVGRRVEREARLVLGEATWLPSLAMRGDMIVVSHDERLHVFTHDRGRWTLVQRETLPEDCVDGTVVFRRIHLGDGVLVVESRDVWCIYEWDARWKLAARLPHESGTAITASGRNVVIVSGMSLVWYERAHRTWRPAKQIAPPKGYWFRQDLAATDHAIAVPLMAHGDDSTRLDIYDASGKRTAAIEVPDGRSLWAFALSSEHVVIGDELGALAWRIGTRRWQHLEGFTGDYRFAAAIGDLIWVGDFTYFEPGRVLGFAPK